MVWHQRSAGSASLFVLILARGIATCAGCGGGMTLRTGKTGRYRCYTCSTCARQGKSACKGRSIPMDKLDRLPTERLAESLLTPEHVTDLLTGLLERQTAKNEDHAARLSALRFKVSNAESRLGRLYAAIESGVADLSDQSLKDRVAAPSKPSATSRRSSMTAPSPKPTRVHL
jgi:site-specific DNA recombinase